MTGLGLGSGWIGRPQAAEARHDGPGDVVVLDNLPAHKPAAIRDAIDAVTPHDARSFFTACGYVPD